MPLKGTDTFAANAESRLRRGAVFYCWRLWQKCVSLRLWDMPLKGTDTKGAVFLRGEKLTDGCYLAMINNRYLLCSKRGKNMLEEKYVDAIKARLHSVPVTTSTIKFIREHSTMHRGSVRIFAGEVYTDNEFSKLRKYSRKKLP
jgi:hypothetical protein